MVPARKLRPLNSPQLDDPIGFGQFPDHEEQEAEQGNNGQADNHRRSEPVEILAFVQHDLKGCHPGDKGR